MKTKTVRVLITAELAIDDNIASNFKEVRKDGDSVIDFLVGQAISVKSGLYENSGWGIIQTAVLKTTPRKS
jgi:hypothetical protein